MARMRLLRPPTQWGPWTPRKTFYSPSGGWGVVIHELMQQEEEFMSDAYHIVIVEDEKLAGKIIRDNLKEKGYDALLFETGEEALRHFRENPVDLVLLDYKLPGISGEELLEKLKELNPLVPVIFMTAYSSVEKAVKLLKMGAYDYLTKPLEMDELYHTIANALEKITLVKENQRLQENLREKFSFENYVFNSDRMEQVINMALRASGSGASILITGESGTGKEVIANIIHHHSPRRNKKFVKVNLSALPETIIEAELFGAVKGAYTGAVPRAGKFEEADGGTIFLDEIGELSPDLQVKLLRVVQEREITRLGSNTPVKVDIRLITATNANLEQLVKEKKFREDFYFRLNVINIELPPLRERREDIPLLVDFFIKKFSKREGKTIETLSKDALNLLVKYHYPGNIRELENIVERAVILARDPVLSPRDLPVFIHPANGSDLDIDAEIEELTLPEILAITEKRVIMKALKKYEYNQSRTAMALGISESGLRYKIQSLKIPRE
jgi:DNA-binding NtrC family response regulator